MADPSASPDLPTSAAVLPGIMEMPPTPGLLPNGKKTKGRVKIKMEYIGNKLRRYTTFSKRKTGIMKKAYELSTLTGTQVMLLVASETGHVYTFATKKLQPMISSDAGKALIQSCLNAPDDGITDLTPNKTEFTFDNGQMSNNRKRKATESSASPEQFPAHMASFLPTMVHNTLFTNFNEDEYNPDDSDDSDSEDGPESKDEKEEVVKGELNEEEKEKEKDISLSLQQTLKEALKAAANNRQAAKRRKMEQQQQQSVATQQAQQQISNALLAPFLLGASTSANGSTVLQLPQGMVSLASTEGGATANSIFAPKTAEEAAAAMNPLFLQSFPQLFNFQQLMESAAVNSFKKE